jgi:Secretion system C-terminal sorting domain/Putative carbohydrate metabolism domain
MNKILFAVLFVCSIHSAQAQLINSGFENWVAGTSGVTMPKPVFAPSGWNGMDSLIIYNGEFYGHFIGAGNNWHTQLFPDSVNVHSGTYSAKLMTLQQDTLGLFPGILVNANAVFVFNLSILTTHNFQNAISYNGGSQIADKIQGISAWVKYKCGKDSTGAVGIDSGVVSVFVYSWISGKDSLIGVGTSVFDSTSAWKQVTANVVYTDTTHTPDSIRVFITSSNGARGLDSSTLWVDDISINYALGVNDLAVGSNLVTVYPNPADHELNIKYSGNGAASFELYNTFGQLVLKKPISGNTTLDASSLPTGMYYYETRNDYRDVTGRGKLVVGH